MIQSVNTDFNIRQRVIQKILEGASVDSVRREENLPSRLVLKWMTDFMRGGLELGLLDGQRPFARKQQLTSEQIRWVEHVLIHKTPEDFELTGSLWTGKLVGDLIRQWCKNEYHRSLSYNLLLDIGFEFEHPSKKKLSAESIKAIESAKPPGAQIIYADEMPLCSKFKVFESGGSGEGATIVRHTEEKTEHTVLYTYNLSRKEIRFLVKEPVVSVDDIESFLIGFGSNFKSLALIVVPKDSIFASKEIKEFLSKHFPHLNIFAVATKG